MGFTLGVVARLIPDLDNSTFSNVIFVLFTLPSGLAIVSARFVLAVEKAVLTEQAENPEQAEKSWQTGCAGQITRAHAGAAQADW